MSLGMVIITGVPEINPTAEAEKNRVIAMGLSDCQDDCEVVLALLGKLNVNDVTVESVLRLPNRLASRRGDMQDKPRILQVKFKEANDKWKVLTRPAITILRGDNNWEKVYISPDRTVKERAADFALREERRRREREGETGLVIRNGQIVNKNVRTSATAAAPGAGARVGGGGGGDA